MSLRPFWRVRHHLAIDKKDGMILIGPRVFVPKILQGNLLRDLLKMHQGTTKSRQRARLSVFWFNMDAEIANLAGSCDECTCRLTSHPSEPLRPREPASSTSARSTASIFSSKLMHSVTVLMSLLFRTPTSPPSVSSTPPASYLSMLAYP